MSRPQTLHDTLPSLKKIFLTLWPWIRRERWLIVSSIVALFAGVAFKLLEPWPIKWVLDYVLRLKPPTDTALWFDNWSPQSILIIAALSVLIATGVRALAEFISSIGFAAVGNRVLTSVRDHLFRHLQKLSLSYHTKARGGDLTVRVISDVNMLKDVAATALLPLTANVLILTGMVGLMFWLEWRLTLLSLSLSPLYWWTTWNVTKKIREAARKQRAREGELAATASESLTAIKDVQALGLENVFADHFSYSSKKCLKESVRTARLAAQLERRIDFIGAVVTALVIFFGARMVLASSMSAGDLVVFLAYLKRSFNPLQDFAKYTGRVAKASAAGERVLAVLQIEPEIRDTPDAQPAPQFRGEVVLENIDFGYEPGHLVLRQVDLTIPAGTFVAIVGPSGIGKSTLMNLLLRLYDPQYGRVMIDGHDIRQFKVDSLRQQISVVLQDGLLFAATIRQNISHGVMDATDEQIESAARMANAHDFINRFPNGYDTVVGERGVTLSHGQRQRLAIARAAVRQSPILLLDEPTSGLDEVNERTVVDALQRLAHGRTTFLVTHDLKLAAQADRIIYLENERVHETGTHQSLVTLNGRYAALYQLQTGSTDALVGGHRHAVAG